MITLRPSNERGRANYGWLDTNYSFSFGDYFDPDHMGFRSLRVINEDVVAPEGGFPTHPHRDMEIITYILDGELEHKDSTGGGSVIHPGRVQRMTAGTGIRHSEFNPSSENPCHLLQIWLLPGTAGLTPGYEEKTFARADMANTLCPIATPNNGTDGALHINQDVTLYGATLNDGATLTHTLAPGRHAWIQVARGSLSLNGTPLNQGDGAAVSDEDTLVFADGKDAEFLLFDLA